VDILNQDILDLWAALAKKKVRYIMVGGFACALHGNLRMTSDVDLWIKDSPINRKRLRSALKEIGFGDFKEVETTQFIPGFTSLMIGASLELDIMTYLKGFEQESFDSCYKISPKAIIEGIPVRFLHINQLIKNKKLTGRVKDKADVQELEKIKKKK
jgi:hypothetical protein